MPSVHEMWTTRGCAARGLAPIVTTHHLRGAVLAARGRCPLPGGRGPRAVGRRPVAGHRNGRPEGARIIRRGRGPSSSIGPAQLPGPQRLFGRGRAVHVRPSRRLQLFMHGHPVARSTHRCVEQPARARSPHSCFGGLSVCRCDDKFICDGCYDEYPHDEGYVMEKVGSSLVCVPVRAPAAAAAAAAPLFIRLMAVSAPLLPPLTLTLPPLPLLCCSAAAGTAVATACPIHGADGVVGVRRSAALTKAWWTTPRYRSTHLLLHRPIGPSAHRPIGTIVSGGSSSLKALPCARTRTAVRMRPGLPGCRIGCGRRSG